MRRETVEAVVRWQNGLDDGEPLEITFHGGEPLVPGAEFYRMVLPLLREGLAPRRVRFGMQWRPDRGKTQAAYWIAKGQEDVEQVSWS